MGLFTKREKTIYVDEEGNKLEEPRRLVEDRRGNWNEKTAGDRFIEQDRLEKRMARKANRVEYRKTFQDARHEAKLKRMKSEGTRAGSTGMGQRFNNMSKGFSIGSSSYGTRSNANPFSNMFDTGISRPRATHKTPKKQSNKYAVVGGKAYPIAGSKKKGKKGKKRSSDPFSGFDLFDNNNYW